MKTAVDRPFGDTTTTNATVLFADMRGYTALAEHLPAARVVSLLEEFFGVLSSATVSCGGEIFHMAGDGMMAGFGVRDPGQYRAREAIAAGHSILRQLAPVSARWLSELSIATGIGIGVHLGEVALGFFGAPGKKSMTLIGDTANVAARLCGRARSGEVLFSSAVAAVIGAAAAVADKATGPIPFLQLPQFELRGRSGLLDIWCVPAPARLALYR